MDQVSLLTMLLMLMVQGGNAPYGSRAGLRAEVPFDARMSETPTAEQVDRVWRATYEIRNQLQSRGRGKLIIQGHAAGANNQSNLELSERRARLVKQWLEGTGVLGDIEVVEKGMGAEANRQAVTFAIDRSAKTPLRGSISIEIPFGDRVVDIRDVDQVDRLWRAKEEISNNLQIYGPGRVIIQGHAARSARRNLLEAAKSDQQTSEQRAQAVKHWFERHGHLPGVELVEKGLGAEVNKRVVTFAIERPYDLLLYQ